MVAFYPDAGQKGIQTMTTAKKEYNSLASTGDEDKKIGDFYPHQVLFQRWMRFNDRAAVFDEMGTGKTCEVVGFCEMAYRERMLWNDSPHDADESLAHFKYTVILVKNDTHRDDIRTQIVNYCSGGRFNTPSVMRAVSQRGRTTAITREIKRWYKFRSYERFAKKVKKSMQRRGEAETIAIYSDVIFWLDELHFMTGQAREEVVESTTGRIHKPEIYSIIRNLFQIISGAKIILTTATPATNGSSEIGSAMNLILPLVTPCPLMRSGTEPLDWRIWSPTSEARSSM